jgi:DNA helicase IV
MTDPELSAERAHLHAALDSLERMRREAAGTVDAGIDAAASEGLARLRAARVQSLGSGNDGPPFFGRIDRQSGEAEGSRGASRAASAERVEEFHLGKRHIRDGSGNPVVIDWRAPIARHFYQATARDPRGVRLRRRFGFADGQLTSYEDEHLDAGEQLGLASDLLREEIERPRVGPMRDIVATIQPDQDELVRADLDTSLCIQGAPGTGKTAVGLHRAAYLLYTYPERLRRSGVLVVGPNSAFLNYIAQVLPTLGEGGIEQATLAELTAHGTVRTAEAEPIATLKGDARLAVVLRTAVRQQIGLPEDDLVVLMGSKRYRVPRERLRRYVEDARRAEARWSVVADRLRHQLAADIRRQREDAGGAPSDAETARIARSPSVRAFVDKVWPSWTPQAVLIRLYTDPEFLAQCAEGVLDGREQALLGWAGAPRSARAAPWTEADLVLLDELAGLAEPGTTYVHVVVDEAQDLSAMQCRVIARRCPLGSLTVLGDLAQATTPWAVGSWPETLRHLGHPDTPVRPLTAGYRVPMPVLQLANRLLPHIAAGVPPATSIRSGQDALGFGAPGELVELVTQLLELPGSLGVICDGSAVTGVVTRLRQAGLEAQLLGTDGTHSTDTHRIDVVPANAAKGLEYDLVVLVEPAAIVAGAAHRLDGLRQLYVCLTRAVSRLRVLHAEPLPPELG